jgi:predicted dehydrogenase
MTQGIVYSYGGSWCAEGLNAPWESQWRIIGEKGSVQWDGREGFRAQVVSGRGGFLSEVQDVALPPLSPSAKVSTHAGLMSEFVHCVRAGGTPETASTDNIKSLAMVFGAVGSAELHQRVDIADW